MKRTVLGLVLIFLLSLPLILPFFRPGYFPTHDGEWAVVRLGAMHRALMSGHFPVRWAGNLNFSYGYPLFLFTYPLPYYLGEVFNLLGFGLVGSIKLLFVLSVIFSGLTMFWLGKEIFGKWGGLISAIFYLYVPFRLVNLYVRGSLGESLALVLFPLLFLALVKIKQGSSFWLVWGAPFYASLLLTHNVFALFITPFWLAFGLLVFWQTVPKKRIFLAKRFLLLFGLGLGLASFFLLPALVEKSQIVLSQMPLADVGQHFVNFSQLIFPSWGYGSPGNQNAFSFQIGLGQLLAFLVAFGFWFKSRKKWRDFSSLVFVFSLVSLAVLIFLMLPASFLFWQKAPLFSEIDFPWRNLGPIIFFLALSLGYLATHRYPRYLGLGLAALAVLFNLGYAKPSSQIDYGDLYYLTNEATTTSNDELMPIWVKEKPTERPSERVEIIAGAGRVENLAFNNQKTSFDLEAETPAEIQINTIYFPGWQVWLDQQPVEVDNENEKGVVRFRVEPGDYQVLAEFKETRLRLVADVISLGSLILVIGFAGRLLVKKKMVKREKGEKKGKKIKIPRC